MAPRSPTKSDGSRSAGRSRSRSRSNPKSLPILEDSELYSQEPKFEDPKAGCGLVTVATDTETSGAGTALHFYPNSSRSELSVEEKRFVSNLSGNSVLHAAHKKTSEDFDAIVKRFGRSTGLVLKSYRDLPTLSNLFSAALVERLITDAFPEGGSKLKFTHVDYMEYVTRLGAFRSRGKKGYTHTEVNGRHGDYSKILSEVEKLLMTQASPSDPSKKKDERLVGPAGSSQSSKNPTGKDPKRDLPAHFGTTSTSNELLPVGEDEDWTQF